MIIIIQMCKPSHWATAIMYDYTKYAKIVFAMHSSAGNKNVICLILHSIAIMLSGKILPTMKQYCMARLQIIWASNSNASLYS